MRCTCVTHAVARHVLSPFGTEWVSLSDAVGRGYRDPSPIHRRAIPRGCLGCDMIARSKTETGTTRTIAVVVLQAIKRNVPPPRALAASATRGIAMRTAEAIRKVGEGPRVLRVRRRFGPRQDGRRDVPRPGRACVRRTNDTAPGPQWSRAHGTTSGTTRPPL